MKTFIYESLKAMEQERFEHIKRRDYLNTPELKDGFKDGFCAGWLMAIRWVKDQSSLKA